MSESGCHPASLSQCQTQEATLPGCHLAIEYHSQSVTLPIMSDYQAARVRVSILAGGITRLRMPPCQNVRVRMPPCQAVTPCQFDRMPNSGCHLGSRVRLPSHQSQDTGSLHIFQGLAFCQTDILASGILTLTS